MRESEKIWVDMSPDEGADIEARAALHGCLTFIIVGAMLLVLMIFGSCTTTKYVTVPEVHEMWHHQTDTIHQTDSIIDRQTTVIREVDSAAMAEYGIQLKDMQRAWLVERNSLRSELKALRETKADTVVVHDSIPKPVPVEVEVPAELTWWQQARLHLANVLLWTLGVVALFYIIRRKVMK